jgi:drug/metabolite transporter (DMT)-like permease
MSAPRPTWATPAMLTVIVIWAGNFLAMRLALAELPLLTVGGIRFAAAAILLLLLLWAVEKEVGVPRRLWLPIFGLGVLGNSIYQILFMMALERTTVGNTSILLATSPLQTAVFGALLGIERPSPRLFGGLLLALCGAVLVLSSRGISFEYSALIGNLCAIGAATCWALYTLGVRRLPGELSPLKVTTLTTAAGAPILILASWSELGHVQWGAVTTTAWVALTYSVVLSIGVAYLLWNSSVAAVGPNRTAIFGCLMPFLAMLVGWAALDEVPGMIQWAGSALIISGVLLGRWSPARLWGRPAR